jgi:hypothetical protein
MLSLRGMASPVTGFVLAENSNFSAEVSKICYIYILKIIKAKQNSFMHFIFINNKYRNVIAPLYQ